MKKSRVKSRLRTQETMERVQKLKTENDMLEEKIKILSKELGFLKDLFLAHAGKRIIYEMYFFFLFLCKIFINILFYHYIIDTLRFFIIKLKLGFSNFTTIFDKLCVN